MRIRDTASLAKKFVARAAAASADYKTGVEAAGQDWADNTGRSEETYAAGVQEAIAGKRFSKGVQNAGAAKYVQRASLLGAQRFPQGVQNAEGEWAKNTAPYLDALKSMDLPMRSPKGSPNNQLRAAAVGAKLRALKLSR